MKFEVCLKVRRWVDVNKTSDEETSPHFCLQVATDSTFLEDAIFSSWYMIKDQPKSKTSVSETTYVCVQIPYDGKHKNQLY